MSKLEYKIEHIDHNRGQDDMELGLYMNGDIIGLVQYTLFEKELTVKDILVRSEYRRKGFASRMMQYIKNHHSDYTYVQSYRTDLGAKFKHKIIKTDLEDYNENILNFEDFMLCENKNINMSDIILKNLSIIDDDFYVEYENNIRELYIIKKGDEIVANLSYMGEEHKSYSNIIETEGKSIIKGSFLVMGTIFVEDKFKRKGIYSNIINSSLEYSKLLGLDGVVSFNYDIDSGEFERTKEATLVWENLLKNQNNVTKIIYKDEWNENLLNIDFIIS